MRKNPGGGPERIRAMSHSNFLWSASLALCRSATRWNKPGKDEAGTSDEVTLTDDDVGGEVVGSPALEKRGCVSTELLEKIAQCTALLRVKRKPSYPYRANAIRPPLAFLIRGRGSPGLLLVITYRR